MIYEVDPLYDCTLNIDIVTDDMFHTNTMVVCLNETMSFLYDSTHGECLEQPGTGFNFQVMIRHPNCQGN